MKVKTVFLVLFAGIYAVNLAAAGSEYNQDYYQNLLAEKYGMENNDNTKEATYAEMKALVTEDKTNEETYSSKQNSKWCAVQVHNYLEKAGYKVGTTIVRFKAGGVRAINVIQCKDRDQPVYVDPTCVKDGSGIDKVVTRLEPGERCVSSCLAGTCKKPYNRAEVKEITTVW